MKKVLILTHEEDPHADSIISHLKKNKIPYFQVYTELLASNYKITFNSENLELKLSDKNQEITLDPSWNIWNRRVMDPYLNEEIHPEVTEIVTNETKEMWKGLLFSHKGKVINDPRSNYKASNKINQIIFARNFGNRILVPETVVTNDLDLVKRFYEKQEGNICFKLQKGSIIKKDGDYYGIYTNKVNEEHMKNIELIQKHPALFQEYREKTYEIRIITIGKKSIGIAIHSQKSERSKIDYRRYDFENVPYNHIKLPENIRTFCTTMLKHYNLHFGAFDFIYDKNKGYIFLELNPNGQWLWLEQLSGYKISKEIADYLSK